MANTEKSQQSFLSSPLFFVHTHKIPNGILKEKLRGSVFVVEQNAKNILDYFSVKGPDLTLDAFFERWPDLLKHLNLSNGFKWLLSIEGVPDVIGFPTKLAQYKALGLRIVQPFHWANNQYIYDGKLTALGNDLLVQMQLLNLILDVSHMQGTLLFEVLEKFSGRIIASHVVTRDLFKSSCHRSNSLSKEDLIALANRSALIGVPFVNDLIDPFGPQPDGTYKANITDLVNQFHGISKIVGAENIAIGPDYFNFAYYSKRLSLKLGVLEGLDTTTGIFNFQNDLMISGYSEEQIDGFMYLNAERFFKSDVQYILDSVAEVPNPMKSPEKDSAPWSFLSSPTELTAEAMIRADVVSPCLPTHAWISLSNFCNYSCKHCRRNYQPILGSQRDISDLLYNRLLEHVIPNLHSLILGGNNLSEITQALKFSQIIKWLAGAEIKLKKLSLQTNGSTIDDDTLSGLVSMNAVFNISVEGGTDETIKKIRGVTLKSLVSQIQRINSFKKSHQSSARIVLSFTAMKSNIEELIDLVTFAEVHGVDEVNVMYLLPATAEWNRESLVHCPEFSNQIIEEALGISDGWNVKLIAPLIREIEDTSCEKPWHSISINGEGDVHFCCLDDSPIIGNLLQNHFAEIWNGPIAQQIRSDVNTARSPSGCSSCVVRNIPMVSASSLRKSLI